MNNFHIARSLLNLIKILFIIIFLCSIGFSIQDISAESSLDYFLLAEKTDSTSSKTFQVNLYVNGKVVLSAATVKITFSEKDLELISVKSASNALTLRSLNNPDSVKTIILCENGYSFQKQAKLLTYRFKQKTTDSALIMLNISDAVDYKLHSLPIGKTDGCLIEFGSKGDISCYQEKTSRVVVSKTVPQQRSTEKSETKVRNDYKTEEENVNNTYSSELNYDNTNSDEEIIIPEKAIEEDYVSPPSERDNYRASDVDGTNEVDWEFVIFCFIIWLISMSSWFAFYKLKRKYTEHIEKVPKKYTKEAYLKQHKRISDERLDLKNTKKVKLVNIKIKPSNFYSDIEKPLVRADKKQHKSNTKSDSVKTKEK